MKLIKFPKANLAEIFQSQEVEFAFIKKTDNGTYEQVHSPVKCRDFLGDCIWSKETGNQAKIWGFTYTYKENPYDENVLRLSITFPNKTTQNNFKERFIELLDIENTLDIQNSIWCPTDEDNTIIIEADNIWQSVQWKLSLYTFYLKRLVYKNNKSLQAPEYDYNKVLTPQIEKELLNNIYNMAKYNPEQMNTAHNNTGFVATIKGNNTLFNEIFKGATCAA